MRNFDRIAVEDRFLLKAGGVKVCEVALKQEKCHRPSDCGEGANPLKSSPIVGLSFRINGELATIAQGREKGFGGTRRRLLTRMVSLGVGMASVAGLVRPGSVRDGIFGVAGPDFNSPESRQPFSVPAIER